MNNSTLITVRVPLDKSITISEELKIKPNDLPFTSVGNGMKNKLGHKSFPFIKAVLTLSKPAQKILDEMLDNKSYKEFYVEHVNKTQTTKMYYQGINELIEKQLILRVKQGVYMINPFAVMEGNLEQRKNSQVLWIHHGGAKP